MAPDSRTTQIQLPYTEPSISEIFAGFLFQVRGYTQQASTLVFRSPETGCIRRPAFPQRDVHSTFIPSLIKDAREAGVARYIEPGDYKYSVVHVDDVAELYVLGLERGSAGSAYHAVSSSGITVRGIAEAIARLVGCRAEGISKEEAREFWGPALTTFFSMNNQVSSSKAERELGWKPQVTISVLEDIVNGSYKAAQMEPHS